MVRSIKVKDNVYRLQKRKPEGKAEQREVERKRREEKKRKEKERKERKGKERKREPSNSTRESSWLMSNVSLSGHLFPSKSQVTTLDSSRVVMMMSVGLGAT